jgi:23S rRNA (adenine2503-C2)-methyltransferase
MGSGSWRTEVPCCSVNQVDNQKRVSTFDEMKNVSGVFRAKLNESFSIEKMKPLVILDSEYRDAVKFGFLLVESKHMVESVLLIDNDRRTACISSQLGCGLGCVFCETARMGFIRNLTQGGDPCS